MSLTTQQRGMSPENMPPFAYGISVDGPQYIPEHCTVCPWVPFRGKYELKYAWGMCVMHGHLTRGAGG